MTDKKDVLQENIEPIEVLKQRLGMGSVVFEGTKAMKGWKNGKEVSEAEFKAAYTAFLESPVDGREGAKG